MSIHPTAVVNDGAVIHDLAEIGPFAVIGANVKIGRGTKIGAHVVIDGHTTIGEDCNIFPGAAIGLAPQDLSYKEQPTGVSMGNRCTIREYVTIHRGSKDEMTVLGDDCFLMNYSHIGHDCKLGAGIIMANGTTLAGHVEVGDNVVFAGLCVFHQFVRIGRLNMISGLTGSRKDLPPFAMCDGRPLAVRGVNVIGMRRQKMSQEVRSAIKESFRLLYRSGLNLAQACQRIEAEIEQFEEVKELVDFIRSSKRGVVARAYDGSDDDDEGTGQVGSSASAGIKKEELPVL